MKKLASDAVIIFIKSGILSGLSSDRANLIG